MNLNYFSSPTLEKECTVDSIASKLTYFHAQIHLQHWQTRSYARHQALGSLYEYIQDFKDELVEKVMGYTDKRPTAFIIPPLTETTPEDTVNEMLMYASKLKKFGEMNDYHDVCNLADSFSGMVAKTKYLLSLG